VHVNRLTKSHDQKVWQPQTLRAPRPTRRRRTSEALDPEEVVIVSRPMASDEVREPQVENPSPHPSPPRQEPQTMLNTPAVEETPRLDHPDSTL
jgi:hypothetical protein